MNEITLKSGHTLVLGLADFEDGVNLLQTLLGELKKADADLSGIDLNNLKDIGDLDLNVVKNAILQVCASKAVLACFFACAKRCTLGNDQVKFAITPASFKPAEFRGDFLPCAWEVMRFNLAPFFESLDLSSLTSGAPRAESPASE